MAMKELAYTAKRQLESATHQSFRNAHVHELLAACFGFKSRAALYANHVLAVLDAEPMVPGEHLLSLQRRLVELGYLHAVEAAGTTLMHLIQERRLGALTIEAVLAELNGYSWEFQYGWTGEDEDDEASASQRQPSLDTDHIDLLIHGLAEVAKRDHAMAHYALALIYRGDDLDVAEGSEYWHSQLAQGRELKGIELEWAQAYKKSMSFPQREAFHFQEAARLGYIDAQLEQAQIAAEQAEEQGDFEGAKRWFTEAATLGDVNAMRALIDEYDQQSLFQNWVWIFFSELLGNDLRKSSLRAYHDGGMYADQDYDDDQGGPLYVAGDEGVELAEVSAEQALEARRIAEQLFSKIAQ